MFSFIKTDEKTADQFTQFIELLKNELKYNGNYKKAEQDTLKNMITKKCYQNMDRTQKFIQYNYAQLKLWGNPQKYLRGYNGIRI